MQWRGAGVGWLVHCGLGSKQQLDAVAVALVAGSVQRSSAVPVRAVYRGVSSEQLLHDVPVALMRGSA